MQNSFHWFSEMTNDLQQARNRDILWRTRNSCKTTVPRLTFCRLGMFTHVLEAHFWQRLLSGGTCGSSLYLSGLSNAQRSSTLCESVSATYPLCKLTCILIPHSITVLLPALSRFCLSDPLMAQYIDLLIKIDNISAKSYYLRVEGANYDP